MGAQIQSKTQMSEPIDEERLETIRQMAKDEFTVDGDLEFDEEAKVSEGNDNGAYVQAWKWVSFANTPFDKKPKA